jgi:hypothetical protein
MQLASKQQSILQGTYIVVVRLFVAVVRQIVIFTLSNVWALLKPQSFESLFYFHLQVKGKSLLSCTSGRASLIARLGIFCVF